MHFLSSVGLLENSHKIFVSQFGLQGVLSFFGLFSAENHLEQLFISKVFIQILGNHLKALESNVVVDCLVAVHISLSELLSKESEGVLQALSLVLLTNFGNHDVQKFSEINTARVVLIVSCNHLAKVLLARVKTEGAKSNFKLLLFNCSATTGVKQVKGILDLLLLVLTELILVGVLGWSFSVFSFSGLLENGGFSRLLHHLPFL